jgi:signal transduction histidine kinase
VIQQLFAVGLALQSIAGRTTGATTDRLSTVIAEIDGTIRQIRSSIYALGSNDDRGVRASVLSLVRELDLVVGFEVKVNFDGPVDAAIPDQLAMHLLATIREAVTNVGRHAQATEASVTVSADNGQCRLQVHDNGRGFDHAETREGGLGLVNLQRRAEKLQGQLLIESPPGGGTSLTWWVPVPS